MTRANDFKAATATFYTYDQGGNLLTREVYPYIDGTLSPSGTTISYGYGNSTWKDLMTSYNGQTITYDTIGNPLQYRDGMTMTWQNGRQLAGISKSGLTTSYTYNGDGIRTGKTVNGVKTSFIVDGSTIVSQQGTAGSGAYAINYLYDENGKAYGFYYNDAIYYYEFNGQGDVVSLLNHYGQLEASYSYDAWGKLLSIVDSDNNEITDANNVANLNIFRYRGYCYDTETGLYYLQSRYYDPNTGRFVNADDITGSNRDIVSYNLFAYCSNNPIIHCDESGHAFHTYYKEVVCDNGDGTYDCAIAILNTSIRYGTNGGLGCKAYVVHITLSSDGNDANIDDELSDDAYNELIQDGGGSAYYYALTSLFNIISGKNVTTVHQRGLSEDVLIGEITGGISGALTAAGEIIIADALAGAGVGAVAAPGTAGLSILAGATVGVIVGGICAVIDHFL